MIRLWSSISGGTLTTGGFDSRTCPEPPRTFVLDTGIFFFHPHLFEDNFNIIVILRDGYASETDRIHLAVPCHTGGGKVFINVSYTCFSHTRRR